MVIDGYKALMIILHYGRNHQLRKMAEESYELIEAVLNGDQTEHVAEEIADCRVMLEQIKQLYCITEEKIVEIANKKIDRQLERIQNERENQDSRDYDGNMPGSRLYGNKNV